MLQLTLPPNRNPVIVAYARSDATAYPGVAGTAVSGRPTLYNFNISGWPDGDFVIDVTNPWGRFLLRKSGSNYLMASEWYELDNLVGGATDPSKVLVNQDFVGTASMTYSIENIPVADAYIEVFLFSDYGAGKHDGKYRIASSRQCSDGTWAMPLYLDPQTYVFRFFRTGVAGPDHYKVIVVSNQDDRDVVPLDNNPQGLAMLGIQLRKKEALRVPPALTQPAPTWPKLQRVPAPEPVVVDLTQEPLALPLKVQPKTTVDHNFKGKKKLIYGHKGKPVAGATLQIFSAADYNIGNRTPDRVIATVKQKADGTWSRSVQLVSGNYVLHCFKRGVIGPDSFPFTVE